MSRHHVLIGGGPAATNAAETIRRFASDDEITLIGDEPAHSRMALPYWVAGQIPREQTHTGDDAYFQRLQVKTRWGERVTHIDAAQKSLQLSSNQTIAFDRLLLATGSRPLSLTVPGADLPGVQPLWRLDDAANALQILQAAPQPRVALVGAGFIGLIVLNALFKRGAQLTVVEREAQVLPRMLTPAAAGIAQRWLEHRGITTHTGMSVTAIEATADGSKQIVTDAGTPLGPFDLIIIATGVQPNVDLASTAGCQVDHGVLVDNFLATSIPDIYAAGDMAQGPVLHSSEKAIHAIQPTAVEHGRVAGANMAGQAVSYPGSLSMNVLDVCGLQCASFGDWDTAGDDRTVISNPETRIHRELVWSGEHLTGAVFAGRPADMGMLTDVGMVKGLIQTRVPLGNWRDYLKENPFDVRRAYIASGAPHQLTQQTLLGEATRPRHYRHGDTQPPASPSTHHQVFVAKPSD